jgi:hypothetical protein
MVLLSMTIEEKFAVKLDPPPPSFREIVGLISEKHAARAVQIAVLKNAEVGWSAVLENDIPEIV